MATAAMKGPGRRSGDDRTRATTALQALNFFMADMQAGIGPFLGVFLQQRGGRRWKRGSEAIRAAVASCWSARARC